MRGPRPILFAGVLLLGVVATNMIFPGRAYDAATWTADEGARGPMADRIVAWGTLDGATREELVAMLGEPPETPYFDAWDLVYRLGMERGFISMDSEWLLFRLGDDGRVAEVRIETD